MKLLKICSLLIISFGLATAWQNDYDRNLYFVCPDNQSIHRIKSVHNNRYEDRIWSFECRPSGLVFDSCSWSGLQNSFDEQLNFQCTNGAGVITGVQSAHHNHFEDRRWNFKCCRQANTCYSQCGKSPYVNGYDDPLNFRVDGGYYLTGVKSEHHNRYEDRIWQYYMCKIRSC